jgi:hypothetical protein
MIIMIWLPNLFDLTLGKSPDIRERTNLTHYNPFGDVSTSEAFDMWQDSEGNEKRKE